MVSITKIEKLFSNLFLQRRNLSIEESLQLMKFRQNQTVKLKKKLINQLKLIVKLVVINKILQIVVHLLIIQLQNNT